MVSKEFDEPPRTQTKPTNKEKVIQCPWEPPHLYLLLRSLRSMDLECEANPIIILIINNNEIQCCDKQILWPAYF